MAKYRDELLDHDYDGIKELDNDLPRWWLLLFYASIVWGFFYLVYYHVLDIGYSSADEYLLEMNPGYVRVAEQDSKFLGLIDEYHSPNYNPRGDMTPRLAVMGTKTTPYVELNRDTDTATYVALTDPASIDAGKGVFTANCASCHGQVGQGGIGPNLADDYWIHEVGMTGVVKSIEYGFPTKGMVAWRGTIKKEQILQVASYVLTLRGTNPPNPKAPQGELVTDY